MIPPNFENIPAELAGLSQWVLWNLETRNGKETKVPYQPTGARARVDDPSTWSDFATVVEACGRFGFSGVGFVLTADDPFSGIDIDGCLNPETGELDPVAAKIVAALPTYSEISPSGRGLRLFVNGALPPGRRRKGKVEMYDAGRYLTLTGARFGTVADIAPCAAELAAVHAEIFGEAPRETPKPSKATPATPIDLDDAKLLELATRAKNGAAFRALWSGDTSGHGGDDSAADLALCNLLAFWTGCDADRMDRLFRQSGLMRPKWDSKRGEGETYGSWTIRKAIRDCQKTYQPGSKSPSKKTQSSPDLLKNGRDNRDNRDKTDLQGENSENPSRDTQNKTGTTGTNGRIRPFFAMKHLDGSLITTNPEVAERLEINRPGLWYVPVTEKRNSKESGGGSTPEYGEPVWISIPFELLATTDDGRGHGHGLAIQFRSLHGHDHTWTIPRALLVIEGRELFQKLYDMGFHMSVADNSFHRLRDYLNRARSEVERLPQSLSVARTGWAPGNRFVLPDHVFGGDGAQVFYQSDDPKPSAYTLRGTLADWRAGVSVPVEPYDQPVFALSCAFAGPLLEPLRIDSGGFHFEGLSSTGKSSAQFWALSAWGEPRELVQSWEGTKVGFELVASAYSDTLMVLDEIGRVDPRVVGTTIYQIMNGSGKLRGNVRLTHRATLRWRTLLLSSGEKSLAQIMAGAPGAVPPVAGQEVRLAHIPVDPTTGIFNGLTDGTKRRALVKSVNDAAGLYYGHAARVFLERLTAPDGLGDATEAAAEVKQIAARLVGPESTNEIDRVALRFALVAFAGELASQYEITGWKPGRALAAATALFKLWRLHWGNASRDETNFLQRLDEWLAEHRPGSFAEIDPVTKDLMRSDRNPAMRSFYGYTYVQNGGRVFYLNAAGWRAATQQTGRGVAISALRRVNRLIAGGDGDGGKSERIAGEKGRFYVIHGERLPDAEQP
ncbi:MAG: DUF927 domain-containing protein [Candidatus Competibacter sp.]|nr:DUF927 domain-containing protein [Candidatus Competibacter sp.]